MLKSVSALCSPCVYKVRRRLTPLHDSTMQSLQFSNCPLVWSTEVTWIFPEIYRFMVRTTRRDIRGVAQFFQRTSRIACLFDYLGELEILTESMRLTLSAVRAINLAPSQI